MQARQLVSIDEQGEPSTDARLMVWRLRSCGRYLASPHRARELLAATAQHRKPSGASSDRRAEGSLGAWTDGSADLVAILERGRHPRSDLS